MKWLRRNVIRSRFMCVITDRGKGIKKVFRQDDLGWNDEFEVTSTQERVHSYILDDSGRCTKANFKYTVLIRDDHTVECTCQKPQLDRITLMTLKYIA